MVDIKYYSTITLDVFEKSSEIIDTKYIPDERLAVLIDSAIRTKNTCLFKCKTIEVLTSNVLFGFRDICGDVMCF